MTAVQRDYARLLQSLKNKLSLAPIRRGAAPGRTQGFLAKRRESCPVIYKGSTKTSQSSTISTKKPVENPPLHDMFVLLEEKPAKSIEYKNIELNLEFGNQALFPEIAINYSVDNGKQIALNRIHNCADPPA